MRFHDHIRHRLQDLERNGLLRSPKTIASPQGASVQVDGREVVLLGSNDYLGHASHPQLTRALQNSLETWGAGAAASRLISGTMTPHRGAEAALCSFFQHPAALLFSTGYAANVGAIQALVGPGDLVLSDALNHASLIDGCRLCRARVVVYPHRDIDALERLLAEHRPLARAALIVSDGVFSMDGDIAPLSELRVLADRYECGLLVDDAHAIGVLGPEGRGSAAALGVIPDVLIGTLGKSLGLAGAFACGNHGVIELLLNRARSYVFSTAPPPALAAAIPEALHLLLHADEARVRVLQHANVLRSALRELGFHVLPGTTPIIPVLFGDPHRAMHASTRLFELGVFAPGIRPPTVPAGTSRLRLVPTAAHTERHIAFAIDAFARLAQELK